MVLKSNIKTKNKIELLCDVILCFYGQRKIKQKEDPFELNGDNEGYFVNSAFETSRRGVFAIGNISNYPGKIKMMITGFGEAATAVGAVVEKVKPGKKMSYFVKKKEN